MSASSLTDKFTLQTGDNTRAIGGWSYYINRLLGFTEIYLSEERPLALIGADLSSAIDERSGSAS